MTVKNEKKILHGNLGRKLNAITSENVFIKKDFLLNADESAKPAIEKADEIKNRIIDYYVQLYFLS